MKDLIELLNWRWIIKKSDPDLYYQVKDNIKQYQDFVKDKLGYAMVINPLLIKLEKLPGRAQPWMGISAFDTTLCYVFFCYVLLYLEDKEPDEQFVLSQITDYISSQTDASEPVDWTQFHQRKALIKVLTFCKEEQLIKISDGDDSGFVNALEAVEVLYENTGISKYFMRRFPFDITEVTSVQQLDAMDWQSDEGDRGIVRRHRVYRRLLLEPVVYQNGLEDQDYLYLKNMRGVLANDFEHYFGADMHLHKNGAMLLFQEASQVSDAMPNRKNISDIVLQCCAEIRKAVADQVWEKQADDRIYLSLVKWESFLEGVRDQYALGWSKGYREMPIKTLKAEINHWMIGFGMIERDVRNKSVWVLPASGKMMGQYPKAFWMKKEDEAIGDLAD